MEEEGFYKNTSRGGASIGIIIILIILVIGGIYIWQSSVKKAPPEKVILEDILGDELIETLGVEDIIGDIEGIEEDLELSDFDDLDLGIDDLEI